MCSEDNVEEWIQEKVVIFVVRFCWLRGIGNGDRGDRGNGLLNIDLFSDVCFSVNWEFVILIGQ